MKKVQNWRKRAAVELLKPLNMAQFLQILEMSVMICVDKYIVIKYILKALRGRRKNGNLVKCVMIEITI